MGLFDELENTPETPEEDVIRRNTERPTLEAPEVAPETPEEVMMVARTVRKQVQEEEGMAFGNPVDFATQFNNTLIGAIGLGADGIAWAGRKAMTTLGASEETAEFFFKSGAADFIKDTTGAGSDEAADTFMGYTGNTFGEAATFLAGGAGVVAKTKTLSGVVGGISRQADVALKTKLGTVVAGEAAVSVGAAGGRQISEENEFGAAGSMATEFATGALALVSAAGAKKVVLDPLTAKLKNMTQKEALEKLSKEEVAEVVAEGQRVLSKDEARAGVLKDAEWIEGSNSISKRILNKEITAEEGVEESSVLFRKVKAKLTGDKPEPETPATPKDTPEPTPAPKTPFKSTTGDEAIDAQLTKTEMMTPDEYLRQSWEATDGKLGGTYESWLASNKLTDADRAKYVQAMKDGDEFPLPYIDKYKGSQDGRNRALAAKEAGINEIPVGIIEEPSVAVRLKDLQEELANTTSKMGRARIQEKIDNLTPKSTPEDAIDASIAATKSILEGKRTDGKGARVTAEVKPHFKAVAVDMSDRFNAFAGAKNADDAKEAAQQILSRIDRFIDFDRIIAKKDYAQGSELVANAGHTTPRDFQKGITAEANQRTADLQTLKNMLEDFTGGAKNADEAAEAASEMAKTLTPDEKLSAIRSHMQSISRARSTGALMSLFDGYFTTRTAMALNQVKTGLVGTMSAAIKHLITPFENTLGSVDGAIRLKDTSARRRLKYALADIAATNEYLGTFKNHWRNLGMNMRNTMLETGDSQLLFKEAQAYKGQDGINQKHSNFFERRNLARAARTEAYNNATGPIDKSYKGFKKALLNNNVADSIPLIFNYGFGLIGSIEEVSLMTLSRRAQKARAIKAGINEGVEDIGKYVDDWMNDAFNVQEDGSMRINYDPKYADGFNEARYDHFRTLDIPAQDIRNETEQAVVAALNKVAETPNELGMLTKFIMMFRGVPTRAGAQLIAYTPPVAAYRVGKIVARKVASAVESRVGEKQVSFGKYASKISELEIDIKQQKKLLNSDNADVATSAERIIAESEDQIARLTAYQRADDYRDIARMVIATGIFLKGYQDGKAGVATGSQSHLTDEQKFAAQKVDGAPNDWKVRWGELELDYRYAEPLKGSYGMGASWGQRQATIDAGALTEDQTTTQFFVNAYRDMFLDMPALQGAKTIVQTTSSNKETRAKAATNLKRQAIPAPAEIRNILKYDEEFIGDTTQGSSTQSAWRAAVGLEQDNYRLTLLGEPKQKEGSTVFGHVTPFGGKRVVERTDLDDILLEDAMSFRSVSEIQTSISGFQLKKFVHVDEDNGETLYSKFGQLIVGTKIGGKNQRKALNDLVKTNTFKDAYKEGYVMNEQGTEINEGVEMIKDIMSEYRAAAREEILETKVARDYEDSDGNTIYNILKEREQFNERPDSLLESLNLK